MGLFDRKEEICANLVYSNKDFPIRYQIKQKTILVFNGNTMNEVNADIILRIDSWEKNNEGYAVSVVTEKQESTTSSPVMKDLMQFLNRFNEPLTHLLFQLNEKSKPIRLLNQSEIDNKWVALRDGELSAYKEEKITNDIIIAWDTDFANIFPLVYNNILYKLFFTPIYGPKKSYNPKYDKTNIVSTLFQGSTIELLIGEGILDISDLGINIEHIGLGSINDYRKIEKNYNDGYKKIVEAPLSYEYNYKAGYSFNNNGVMTKCNAEIQEKASEKVISTQSYSISILQ